MMMTMIILLVSSFMIALSSALTTCPGFPGFCSESFPGQTCNVVCDFGRNNVPLCQEDGTWTDIPRCIEHDPGVEEQVPGLCPGIPADGTWAPYPTCEGDLRETQDGCDGCP